MRGNHESSTILIRPGHAVVRHDNGAVVFTIADEQLHANHPLVGGKDRIRNVGIAVRERLKRGHGPLKICALKVNATKAPGPCARNQGKGGLNGRGVTLGPSLARWGARGIRMCAALHEAIAAAHEVRGDEHIFHTR